MKIISLRSTFVESDISLYAPTFEPEKLPSDTFLIIWCVPIAGYSSYVNITAPDFRQNQR